ncbi:hypothetical protein HDV01_004213 [Terramyces sp. JEL0728]|nr:hypothetical protein HDV01_004213 [Terramyces sp. JEL0728]
MFGKKDDPPPYNDYLSNANYQPSNSTSQPSSTHYAPPINQTSEATVQIPTVQVLHMEEPHTPKDPFKLLRIVFLAIFIPAILGAVAYAIYEVAQPPFKFTPATEFGDFAIICQFCKVAFISQFSYISIISQFSVISVFSMGSVFTFAAMFSAFSWYSMFTIISAKVSCFRFYSLNKDD